MNVDLNEQQLMLQKMARDFMADKVAKKLVRDLENDPKGFTPELWNEMAGLGWMGLALPEKCGGLESSFLDLCILLEEQGRGALPGPFFSTVVLGGMLINDAGHSAQKDAYLPKIAEGKLFATLALPEASVSYDPKLVETKAVAQGADYVISGTKLFVTDAHVADIIITAARTAKGVTLFIVDAKSAGVKITPMHTVAGDKQSVVEFANVKVPATNILGEVDQADAILAKFMPKAVIAKCAEMVGAFQAMFDLTLDYAKTRIAFGKPIGTLQAVQFYMANMNSDLDSSRLMTYKAAWMLSEGMPCDKLVHACKAWLGDCFRNQSFKAHQIHGAMGFTWDCDLQLFIRRGKAWELQLGSPNQHRESILKQLGL